MKGWCLFLGLVLVSELVWPCQGLAGSKRFSAPKLPPFSEICEFQIRDDPFRTFLRLRETLSTKREQGLNMIGRLDRLHLLEIRTGIESFTDHQPKLIIRMVADGDAGIAGTSECNSLY
jgi:hypothetical protein